MKVAGKRAQDRTCLGYAEREQVRRRQRAKSKDKRDISHSLDMDGSVLTLSCCLVLIWLSCYTNFLAAKKLQKAPAHGKISQPALCSRIAFSSNIFRSRKLCHLNLPFVLRRSGTCAVQRYKRKYNAAALQTVLA